MFLPYGNNRYYVNVSIEMHFEEKCLEAIRNHSPHLFQIPLLLAMVPNFFTNQIPNGGPSPHPTIPRRGNLILVGWGGVGVGVGCGGVGVGVG